MNTYVCKQEDEFIFEKLRWIAELSNGEQIFQDDDRPGLDEPKAWIRLGNYCRQNRLSVVGLRLQFRSHVETPLPANAEGYIYSRKSFCVDGGPTYNSYLIGIILNSTTVYLQEWLIPELTLIGEESRTIESIDPIKIIRKCEHA